MADQKQRGMTAIRMALAAGGVVVLSVSVVFLLAPDWAQYLWPWEMSRLSRIFIASILAASAIPVIWAGLTDEIAAVASGSIDLSVMYALMAIYLLVLGAEAPNVGATLLGVASVAFAVGLAMLFIWSERIPFRDRRPMPRPVFLSFWVFASVLTVVGTLLALGVPNIFPWPLARDTSAMYGFIYLGAAAYFVYGIARPVWGNAKGQLLGFLAYDVVLIPPFLLHFSTVRPEMRMSLIVYTTVLFVSAVIAIHYLFLNSATRLRMSLSAQPVRAE
ncbi:MAG: hypothetical protein F9K19_00705 [Rhizobiaceae bacterium]|nr:MAG: hypothetical protein F9K19_00705 [Rhizobiaceae bacterium]CAG0952109.1 hypothetical protein RHIZO_00245 [Rhizobiaceae bacterium]